MTCTNHTRVRGCVWIGLSHQTQCSAPATKPPFLCRLLWTLQGKRRSVLAFQKGKLKSEVEYEKYYFILEIVLIILTINYQQNGLTFYLFILKHHTSLSAQVTVHHRQCEWLELLQRWMLKKWVIVSLCHTCLPVPSSHSSCRDWTSSGPSRSDSLQCVVSLYPCHPLHYLVVWLLLDRCL